MILMLTIKKHFFPKRAPTRRLPRSYAITINKKQPIDDYQSRSRYTAVYRREVLQ